MEPLKNVQYLYFGTILFKKQYYALPHSTGEQRDFLCAEMLEQRPLMHYSAHYLCKDSIHKLFLWAGQHNGCCISNMFTS